MASSECAATTAVVPLAGFQPVMSPVWLSKMKIAGRGPSGVDTWKPVVPLNTWPVGAPLTTVTSSAALINGVPPPPPRYRVEVPLTLFATQSGLVGDSANPHGLTSSGSRIAATPGWSDTALTWTNRLSFGAA
jgi:hypothetical protein